MKILDNFILGAKLLFSSLPSLGGGDDDVLTIDKSTGEIKRKNADEFTEVGTHDNTKHSTNYEAEGTASSVMSSHESDHPAPTNRDTRNAAASHSHASLHSHSNKSVLDKFGELDGDPTWNGEGLSSGGVFSFGALFEAGGYEAEVDMSDSDNRVMETITKDGAVFATRETEFDTPGIDKTKVTVVCSDMGINSTKIIDMTNEDLITYNEV